MTSPVSDVMLRALKVIADAGADGVRTEHDGTGKSLLQRGLVQKVFKQDSPWNYYSITPQGEALLAGRDLATLIIKGVSRAECVQKLGVTDGQYFYQARKLRNEGKAPPRAEISGDAWAADRARCGAGPVVGSRADLLDNIGLDLLRTIAAECPSGVTLMTWIAGIVKDTLADDDALGTAIPNLSRQSGTR